ncbi:MAG: class I SAM-dependent RNA methyltransferase [Desulfurivibrionaceae bacterium]|nr:class I SAM-dependent RNA methyltransferase [Desulfurivibrionaceae bacterium]
MHTEKVVIDKVVTGGLGLGRMADGMVFMTPWVLPGEEVLVRTRRRRKNYLEAELVEVLTGSPRRIVPPCPHFGVCGGCDLQHAEYGYQLEIKAGVLREHLAGAGIIDESELEKVTEEPLAADRPFGYRQRLRLQVGNGGYGFFRGSSHEVEVVDSCPLAMSSINRVMESLAAGEAMTHLLDTAREIELQASPGDDSLILIVRLRRKPRPADIKAANRACDQLDKVKAVYLAADSVRTLGPYCGSGSSDDDEGCSLLLLLPFPAIPNHRIPAYTLSQEAGGFSQVNPEQNRKMIETMLDWVDTLKAERALDLFGGMGNFAIPLAMKLKEVVGLDRQRAAIRSAEHNAEKTGLTNCSFIRKSAEEGIKEFGAAGEVFDLVLLDPPRRGCREVLPFLGEIGGPAVIYISCDPATLARDLKDLSDNGYSVRKVKMVDMFPQTHHLESMVLLTR